MDHPGRTQDREQTQTGPAASRVVSVPRGGVLGLPDAQPVMGEHPRGKLSSWLLIGTVIAVFLAGGAAIILHLWWLLFTCAGVALLAVPVGKAIGIMNDTVVWGATGPGEHAPGSATRE